MSLGQSLAPHLAYLRRYARALTGNQESGDAYVRAALEAILAAPADFPRDVDARLGLFRMFQAIWQTAQVDTLSDHGVDATSRRLSQITPASRQALLLHYMEGFSVADIGYLMAVDAGDADALLKDALASIEGQTRTGVLIIEDEPIIAMDIESIVLDLGHEVTGIAATHEEALNLARQKRPGLILADIQLADDSSGIEAVRDILQEADVPVIFITAFPERLLTGERPEPTFLITKPFHPTTVRAAISQALFFAESVAEAV